MNRFELYDFDTEFSHYLQSWYEQNFGRYRTYDDMEDCVPDVYQTFLDTPAAFIGGKKPGEYFEQFDDPVLLVDWLAEYVRKDVNVPDMLLNRISELGEIAAPPIVELLQDLKQPNELRMHLISLLREIESPLPYPLYIDWIARWDGKDELIENAVETLESANITESGLSDRMKAAYKAATVPGKVAFLSILSRDARQTDMVPQAIRLFEEQPAQRIHLAAVLARFGQPEALDALKKAALSRQTGYLLYIELRSAIEALGGEAPKRKFLEGDSEYDSMRLLQDQ